MNDDKQKIITFDPNHPAWRHKLWVRLRTHEGIKTFIIWRRMWKALVILVLAGWLGLAGAAWSFVRYRRGVTEARFVDIAFFPFRHDHYRQALASHYALMADKAMAAGKWSDAVLSLRRAVANNPRDLDSRQKLADFLLRTNRTDLAVQLLESGLPYAGDNAGYLRMLFTLLQNTGQTEHMLALGAGLLPARPDDSPGHQFIARQMAEAYINLKRYDQAKTFITQRKLDDTPAGQMLLAQIDSDQGFDDLALVRLRALHARQPGDESATIQLVALYRKMGRNDAALQLAMIRSFQHPNSPGALVDVLKLELDAGDASAVNRDFASYLGQFSADIRALDLLGRALIGQRRPDLVRRIRDAAPKDAAGHPPLALSLLAVEASCLAQDYQSAAQEAQTLAAAQPNLPPAWQARLVVMRSWAAFGMGDQVQGAAWLNQYLTIQDPDAVYNRLALAQHIEALAPPATVRQLLASARQLAPQDRRPLLALAAFDLSQKDWPQVAQWLPDALALNPPPPADLLDAIWQSPAALQALAAAFVSANRPDMVRQLRNHAPKDASGRSPLYLDLAVAEADCGSGDYAAISKEAGIIAARPDLTPADAARLAALRCWAAFGLGDEVQGAADLNQYLALRDPAAVDNRLTLARRIEKLAPPESVRTVLASARDLAPGDYRPLLALAAFAITQRDWTQAAHWVSGLIALNPPPSTDQLRDLWQQQRANSTPADQAQIMMLRCWAAYGLGEQNQGAAWLGQYLSLPDSEGVDNRLALAQRLEKFAPPAAIRQLLASARQLAPQDRKPLLALAAFDLSQKDWPQVSQWLPDALALNPPAPTDLLNKLWQQGKDALSPALRAKLAAQLKQPAAPDAP